MTDVNTAAIEGFNALTNMCSNLAAWFRSGEHEQAYFVQSLSQIQTFCILTKNEVAKATQSSNPLYAGYARIVLCRVLGITKYLASFRALIDSKKAVHRITRNLMTISDHLTTLFEAVTEAYEKMLSEAPNSVPPEELNPPQMSFGILPVGTGVGDVAYITETVNQAKEFATILACLPD